MKTFAREGDYQFPSDFYGAEHLLRLLCCRSLSRLK